VSLVDLDDGRNKEMKKNQMTPPRTKFVDFDARPQPKTKRWCCKCQKDLAVGKPHRNVYLDDQMCAVHPEDLHERGTKTTDYGWNLLGMDCAKALGLEWSMEEKLEL
jgi:hypothetical protein